MNVRIPTSDPRKAQAAQRAGAEGWYVRIVRTKKVIAGPYEHEERAQRLRDDLNALAERPEQSVEAALYGRRGDASGSQA